jgi:hypothetical protein
MRKKTRSLAEPPIIVDGNNRPCLYVTPVSAKNRKHKNLRPHKHDGDEYSYYWNIIAVYGRSGSAPAPFVDINGEPRTFDLEDGCNLVDEEGTIYANGEDWRLGRLHIVNRWIRHWENTLYKNKQALKEAEHETWKAETRPRTRCGNRVLLSVEYYEWIEEEKRNELSRTRAILGKLYDWHLRLTKNDPVAKFGVIEEIIA